jgi:hypothetical protein
MRHFVIIASIVMFLTISAQAQSWTEYDYPDFGFELMTGLGGRYPVSTIVAVYRRQFWAAIWRQPFRGAAAGRQRSRTTRRSKTDFAVFHAGVSNGGLR